MRCVIISGSPDTSVEEIKTLCTDDDFIVCADSGYTFARKAGLKEAESKPDINQRNYNLILQALRRKIYYKK